MSSIKAASVTDKKNSKIFKKTKLFFSKRKSKHTDSLNLDNSISYISNKEDSNKTLNIIQNDGDEANLKQNKPILSNSGISLDEKSILSKSEVLNDKNENLDNLNHDINLEMKINDINKSFKNMTNEWHSTNAEISERLNCLMWQMNQFQKEQTELSQKIKDNVDNLKETVTNESQKTLDLKENFEQIKRDSEKSKDENNIRKKAIDENYLNQQSELQSLNSKLEILQSEFENIKDSLNSKINEIEKSSEVLEDSNKIQKKEIEENIENQKSELMNTNSKLENLQKEFEELNEKVISLNSKLPQKETSPKKIDINSCDDNLIEYITQSVYEKIKQQHKFNELDSIRELNQDSVNNINVKINELSEKLDEFQVYQLSREVEWYQMKIKLDDTMNKINEEFEQLNNEKRDKMIEKWNKENNKLKETQERINRTIFDLQTTIDDVKTDIYESLNKQQNAIDNISKTTELLQIKNKNEVENATRNVNENKASELVVSENNDMINKTITSLSDDIKILKMETKVMTTNISLLWEDVRSIKNFINQYDMNERLKEKESSEEYKNIRNEINNLKKRLDEL